MRDWMILAALVLLAACEPAPQPGGIVRNDPVTARDSADAGAEAGLATPSSAFDYRYRYRMPPGRIAAVQEGHARGCDQLGSARCRITAMRYVVGKDNTVAALLTIKVDPAIARAFGMAATRTVTNAKGVLIDADIAGADSVAATGRSDTVIAKLRDALGNADAQARAITDPAARLAAAAKADRLRAAITAIGEVNQGAAATMATTPMIFTYNSGGPVPGLGGSSEASFDAAGQTLLQSLSGLAVILAGIGPWIVLLVGGALILRRFIQPAPAPAPEVLPAPRDAGPQGNVIERWFRRDDATHPETVD